MLVLSDGEQAHILASLCRELRNGHLILGTVFIRNSVSCLSDLSLSGPETTKWSLLKSGPTALFAGENHIFR